MTENLRSPTAADAAKRQAVLKYHAWVQGFQEQTLNTLQKGIVVLLYDWPNFHINQKATRLMAPSVVTLTAMPSTGQPWKLEKPTYAWRLPESAVVQKEMDRGRVIQVSFPNAGQFDVSVDITDARGSTATAAATVSLEPATPFVVSFEPLFSNTRKREPLDVVMRPRVTGGHPDDRLTEYVYSVDDPQAAVVPNLTSGSIKGLTAGNRTIRLDATSKLGKAVQTDYAVTVAANQPPECTVTSRVSGDYTWYTDQCTDSDGRVTGWRWYLDGKLISSGQTIRRGPNDPPGVLRFEAYDDGGAVYREVL